MPDSTLSTLSSIRTKIRRLTKSPNEAQLTNATIDSYINSFVLYDMPADVTLHSLKKVLRFYTEPYVETYATSSVSTDPLYNFKNKYVLASNTVFINGSQKYFTQSRADYYSQSLRANQEESIGTGDGVLTNFTGTLTGYPIHTNNVTVGTTDVNGNFLKLYDDGAGAFSGDGSGTINYITGAYDVTFNTAPASAQDIYMFRSVYTPSKPTRILFFEDTFYLSPVPDKSYEVEVEVYQRPTEFLSDSPTQEPQIAEWWEFMALGAARKILFDRADFETAAIIEQELENKRVSVLQRTARENSIQRGYGL